MSHILRPGPARSDCLAPARPGPIIVLLTFVLMVLALPCRAEPPPPFVLHSHPDQSRLTIYSEYLRDASHAITLESLLAGHHEGAFQPATHFMERLGISEDTWWVRVALKNELSDQQRFVLSLSGISQAQIFLVDEQGHYQRLSDNKRLPGRDVAYQLDLPTGNTQLFYIHLRPYGKMSYGLTLNTRNHQIAHQNHTTAFYMLFSGGLLILALYNLMVGSLRGGPVYFYHSLFLLMVLGASLMLAGYTLPLNFMSGYGHAQIMLTLMLAAVLSVIGMARNFFGIAQQTPGLDYTSRGLQVLTAFTMAGLWILPLTLVASLCYLLIIITGLFLLILGYLSWHREVTGGGLFFLATLLISVPAVLACLANLGLWHSDAELPQWLLVSTVLEAVVVGVGLRLQYAQTLKATIDRHRQQAVDTATERTRRDTLARIGHDIRTPLSGVMGMSEILRDTPLTPNQRDCVSEIQTAGNNLLRIINDVLEHSQLSTQGADINRSSIDMNRLVMEALDLFRERAAEKQVELITHIHTNVPRWVEGDADRLRQVLTNLVATLLRHAHHGELVLDIAMEATGQADQIRFEFGGSAVGRGTLQQIKDSREQTDSNHLSLPIAEQLVAAMGGRLSQRQDHYGFILPLPPCPNHNATVTSDVDTSVLTGRSLLVVDDSSTVTRVLRHQALSWGMRVTACHDPREALASLRTQANIHEPYDAVVLDHHMPGIDGMQLAMRIHEDTVVTHPTVLIMLTGMNDAPTTTQARNVGVHRVLSKPVSTPCLRQALTEELGPVRHGEPAPTEPLAEARPDPNLKLLVAEDHHLSQRVIRGMLGKLELSADMVSNGHQALEKAMATRYDLIIMDCEMPGMDGFEATRRIRQHEQSQGQSPVPVIALTAHILREHQDRSLAAGMNDYLPKPLERETLRQTLLRFTAAGATDSGSAPANDETPE